MFFHTPTPPFMSRRVLLSLFGTAALTATAQEPLVITSVNSHLSGLFGNALSTAGDVTGDGVDDVAVGAWNEWWNNRSGGRVYVHDGTSGALVHALRSPSPEPQGAFGMALASVGDLDADGAPDLAVGAPEESPGGRAYVFSGRTGRRLLTLQDAQADRLGYALAPAGDIDADGTPDILVGSYHSNQILAFSGANGQLLHRVVSQAGGDFGRAATGGMDLTGDGVADWVVAARREFVDGVDAGRVYVIDGATRTVAHAYASPRPSHGGQFGLSLALCPDADGDGLPEVAIGAGRESGSLLEQGRAYLFSGASSTMLHTYESLAPAYQGWFGQNVTCVGDLDGDSMGDLAIGAAGQEGNASRSGMVYVFSTGTGDPLSQVVSSTAAPGGRFGIWLAPIRAGAGATRLAIGAAAEGEASNGAVHLVPVVRSVVGSDAQPPPARLSIGQPSPNPTQSRVAVPLDLPSDTPVSVQVLDIQGRRVADLTLGTLTSGTHHVGIGIEQLPAGNYTLRVRAGATLNDRRFTIVR